MTTGRLTAAVSVAALLALAPLLVAMTAVRNAQRMVIGYLDERPDGRVFVRDCQQRLLGFPSR